MDPKFTLRLARSPEDIMAAQRLRYRVFVEELGGHGAMVDDANRLEKDRFDAHFEHLILIDEALQADPLDRVVGVYRLLNAQGAAAAGQFYSEDEYDLGALKSSGRKLLELGRSCLHPDYRGGSAMFVLWSGLAEYILENEIEILFGVASFHGADSQEFAEALSLLHHRHLAPGPLRVRARQRPFQPMDLIPEAEIDRRRAMRAVPALIKAYLRLGGYVGEGAFVDHAFNTTDVCLILDVARMNEKQKTIYTKGIGS
ncbi:GNAT family N-acetyltransferase [Shimia sp.]|uniref:GNAT family N-acetyltransferase n=1 Tax=Shimia sp. TaxID=1954381 RepID=UPI003564AC86